jgi:hypothetical protein
LKIRKSAAFWIESSLAVSSASACALTVVLPNWIEQLFDFSPDANDGSSEWGLVITLAIMATAFAALASREFRAGAKA